MKPKELEVGKLYWSPEVPIENQWMDVLWPSEQILMYVRQETPTTDARSLYVFLTGQGTELVLTKGSLTSLERKLK